LLTGAGTEISAGFDNAGTVAVVELFPGVGANAGSEGENKAEE
jgi:hypothetical protein